MPDDRAYPPEPWRLTGELELAAWLIPAREIRLTAPAGWRPFRLFGRSLVGAVFAHYAPGGDLAYRELALGVAVRRGLSFALTLPWIWVDDPRALEGGRELWAIPKQLASFRRTAERLEAEHEGGRTIASLHRRILLALPGRWSAELAIAQPDGDDVRLTPARLRGRLSLARSRWRAAGPLEMLDGRRPILSLRLDQAEMLFGEDEAASSSAHPGERL
jgi:hypothetical protein